MMKMTKEEAISRLEAQGWIINAPDEITVDQAEEDCIFLSQEGNGEWIVSLGGSVTFFESLDEDKDASL